jgi:DNA-directed RNA polymerase specialized sigma24 family protein
LKKSGDHVRPTDINRTIARWLLRPVDERPTATELGGELGLTMDAVHQRARRIRLKMKKGEWPK